MFEITTSDGLTQNIISLEWFQSTYDTYVLQILLFLSICFLFTRRDERWSLSQDKEVTQYTAVFGCYRIVYADTPRCPR